MEQADRVLFVVRICLGNALGLLYGSASRLLDATHLALCMHMVYWYLVTNFFNPQALPNTVWSFKVSIKNPVTSKRTESLLTSPPQAQIIVDASLSFISLGL